MIILYLQVNITYKLTGYSGVGHEPPENKFQQIENVVTEYNNNNTFSNTELTNLFTFKNMKYTNYIEVPHMFRENLVGDGQLIKPVDFVDNLKIN